MLDAATLKCHMIWQMLLWLLERIMMTPSWTPPLQYQYLEAPPILLNRQKLICHMLFKSRLCHPHQEHQQLLEMSTMSLQGYGRFFLGVSGGLARWHCQASIFVHLLKELKIKGKALSMTLLTSMLTMEENKSECHCVVYLCGIHFDQEDSPPILNACKKGSFKRDGTSPTWPLFMWLLQTKRRRLGHSLVLIGKFLIHFGGNSLMSGMLFFTRALQNGTSWLENDYFAWTKIIVTWYGDVQQKRLMSATSFAVEIFM